MLLLNSTEKYDVVLTETSISDVTLLFAERFQAPLITFVPNVILPWLSDRMGNPDNPAYVPNIVSGYLDKMTFMQRVQNTILYVGSVFLYKYSTSRNDNDIIRSLLQSAPPVEDMIRNTSLLFISTNSAINPPIPLVPGVVDIGGIHIKSAKILPQVVHI